jgi:hypothetical protein
MKVALSLALLFVCFELGNAVESPKLEEFASSMYQKASERAALFFKSAGTPVVDDTHPSFRAESDPGLHERATAHLTFYKDDHCTERDYILDLKINRCGNYMGNTKATILGESSTSWLIQLQPYDAACENPIGGSISILSRRILVDKLMRVTSPSISSLIQGNPSLVVAVP